MTISVSNNTPRVSYTVAEGQTQTSFTVNFEFFADADLRVFVDNTLKTITTHYTVSGGNGSTGSINMSVTGASGGSIVVITRDIALERTTDFPTQGAFNISSLNTELDKLVAIDADVDDTIGRSIRLQDSDASASMELPLKASRVGTVMAFNSTTGAVEAGPSIGSVTTVATQSANINTLAGINANITTVAGIQANVTTVAGIASNVSTVAGISSNVTTVAGISNNVTTVAGISSDVTAVANIASDVSAVENIKSDVTSVANNSSNINSAVSNASNINSAVSNASNINAVVSNASNINTVAGIDANVTTVAGIASNVTSVAGIASNVTTVAGINTTHLSNVSGVSSNVALLGTSDAISDLNTLAAISSDITSLANSLEKTYTVTVANPGSGNVFVLDSSNAPSIEMFRGNTYIFNQNDATNDGHPLVFKNGSSAYEVGVTYFLNGSATTQSNYVNVTTFNAGRSSGDRKVQIEVATSAPSSGLRYYCYVHGNGMGNTITVKDSNISLVAGSIANVNSVGGALTNVNTVAGSISNVNTVAGANSNITTVAGANSNITTVAGAITNVNNVGNAIANVNTVASNISGVNSFAERYRVASSAPTSSLDAGDLYFNTTANTLNFYNGSSFVPVVAGAMTSLVVDTTPQLGGSLDVNGNSIVSTSNGDITIAPNGSGAINLNGSVSLNGVSLSETISDTVGAMVSGNTESNITVTYQDSDNTLDFSISSSDIRSLVESASDSNVFTDADHSKLDGIEASATADQTASEILTLIKTVDGSGSGLDADTLDGISSDSFLRSDTADTASGDITFSGGAGAVTISAGSDIRGTSGTWTGEASGKIQFHINYLYFQATSRFMFRNASGSDIAHIDSSGNSVFAGNVTAFSDERLKTDIKTIDDALDICGQLRGVSFKWIESNERSIGVIAQEVEKVIPEIVLTNENTDPATNETTETKSVDYGKIVSVLINAINELKAEVDELKRGK